MDRDLPVVPCQFWPDNLQPCGLIEGIYIAGNYNLAEGSSAIAKGADLSAAGFATDIGGTSRPQGAAWDIGAYEFTPPKKKGGQVTSQ